MELQKNVKTNKKIRTYDKFDENCEAAVHCFLHSYEFLLGYL